MNSVEVIAKAQTMTGYMDPVELAWLFNKAREMKDVVEIGSYMGRSTYALLSGCRGTVYAIDHWLHPLADHHDDPNKAFMYNVGHFPNLVAIRLCSVEASYSELIPPLVDMIFVDADHEYEAVKHDLIAWGSRARKVICGHDWGFKGVAQAVREYFGPGKATPGAGSIWQVEIPEGGLA